MTQIDSTALIPYSVNTIVVSRCTFLDTNTTFKLHLLQPFHRLCRYKDDTYLLHRALVSSVNIIVDTNVLVDF